VTAKLDYQWRLRPMLAERGIYTAAQLRPLLAGYRIALSESQVYRLLTGKPERMNLRVLMALCELLDCTPNELIVPVEASLPTLAERRAAAAAGVAEDIVPRPARIPRGPHDRDRH
jgi:DNA-binding Xre family transcriptional regulator